MPQEAFPVVLTKKEGTNNEIRKSIEDIALEVTDLLQKGDLVQILYIDAPSSNPSARITTDKPNLLVIIDKKENPEA